MKMKHPKAVAPPSHVGKARVAGENLKPPKYAGVSGGSHGVARKPRKLPINLKH